MSNPHDVERLAAVRQQLRMFWRCAQGLRPEWRAAFLLNLPAVSDPKPEEPPEDPIDRLDLKPRKSGRSTERGEIDVLVAHGIASIHDIGETLAFTPEQYNAVFAKLGEPGAAASIYALWNHLPLKDKTIAVMLGKTGEQVLAFRTQAIRQMALCMRHAMTARAHNAAPRSSSSSEVIQ